VILAGKGRAGKRSNIFFREPVYSIREDGLVAVKKRTIAQKKSRRRKTGAPCRGKKDMEPACSTSRKERRYHCPGGDDVAPETTELPPETVARGT